MIFFRYRGENVLDLDLDMPVRNTMDYEGPVVAPKILAILDEALQVEDNIDIDASKVRGSSARVPSKVRSVLLCVLYPVLTGSECRWEREIILLLHLSLSIQKLKICFVSGMYFQSVLQGFER